MAPKLIRWIHLSAKIASKGTASACSALLSKLWRAEPASARSARQSWIRTEKINWRRNSGPCRKRILIGLSMNTTANSAKLPHKNSKSRAWKSRRPSSASAATKRSVRCTNNSFSRAHASAFARNAKKVLSTAGLSASTRNVWGAVSASA